MSVYDGDFLGFQLGDIHSSQLNITRVSSGDRYTENLTSNFNDVTEQVPGADGTYYWNTYYTQHPFIIDFAFDDLRDEDIRRLKQILSFKGVQPLIFFPCIALYFSHYQPQIELAEQFWCLLVRRATLCSSILHLMINIVIQFLNGYKLVAIAVSLPAQTFHQIIGKQSISPCR